MSHGSALRSPLRVGPAVAELDEVKGVLDKDIVESVAVGLGFQGRDVLVSGKLAGDAVVEDRQGSGAETFSHEQVLVEADILRGPVAPVVAEADALLARAD